MVKNLDLTKVSENLTPKERAKLVISLRNKSIDEVLKNEDFQKAFYKHSKGTHLEPGELETFRPETSPFYRDALQIIASCPPDQAREYNAYIELEQRVSNKALPDIEYNLQYLDALEGRIAPLRYAFGVSPLTYEALEAVERLPKTDEAIKEIIRASLKLLLPIRMDKDKKKLPGGEGTEDLRLSTSQVEEALIDFIAKAQETIKKIQNNIALVEAVEEKHFDGMRLVIQDDPTDPEGTIPRALKAVEELAKRHNSHMQLIEETFSKHDWRYWKYKIERLDNFLINPNQEASKEWVEVELRQLERGADING